MLVINYFKQHYDVIFLTGALLFLILAINQPTASLNQSKSLLFVVDVTQSMNVQDMFWHHKPVSRLEFTKQLLKETIKKLPCGTQVGLGIFFKTTTTLLYTPIETCENYHLLSDTIDHIDWRMASQGNSNIRLGLISTLSIAKTADIPAAHIAFFTDGNEAPPLNVFTKTNMKGWQSSSAWSVVGVGDNKPSPIPKLDAKNQVIGYWSTDAIKLNPASNVDQGHGGGRDNAIATESYEYYLSRLDESYLKALTTEIGADYVKATTPEALLESIGFNRFNAYIQSLLPLKQVFALIALLLMLAVYVTNFKR